MTDERTLSVKIAQDMCLFVKEEHICSRPSELADDDSRALSGGDSQRHDAVMLELSDVVESAALNLGP
jgi:hypothetical protein